MKDIEKIFHTDIRDKKRTASGIYHRASRRGYIRGGVKTQSDFLSAKEKKALNGEVIVSNMYNDVSKLPSFQELKAMPVEDAKRIFSIAKSLHSNSKLLKHWGISTGRLYSELEKLGLHTPKKGTKPRKFTPVRVEKDGVFSNIDEIPVMNDLMQLPYNKIKGILIAGKNQFGVTKLEKRLGISHYRMYQLLKKYEAMDDNIQSAKKNKEEVNVESKEVAVQNSIFEEKKEEPQTVPLEVYNEMKTMLENISNELNSLKQVKKEEVSNGFNINFGGEYEKEELSNRLLSMAEILMENKKYKIELSIKEI